MTTYTDFVRTTIPDAAVEEVEFILWEHTPFPMVKHPEELQPYIDVYVKNVRKHYLAIEESKKGKG